MSKTTAIIEDAINEMFDDNGLREDVLRTVGELNPPTDNTPSVKKEVILPTTAAETETFVKKRIIDAISGGEEALEELLVLAKSLQHPQAYDAISKLIKQITDSAVALSKIKVEAKQDEQNPVPKKQTNIQNNITNHIAVTGSLSDIINATKNQK